MKVFANHLAELPPLPRFVSSVAPVASTFGRVNSIHHPHTGSVGIQFSAEDQHGDHLVDFLASSSFTKGDAFNSFNASNWFFQISIDGSKGKGTEALWTLLPPEEDLEEEEEEEVTMVNEAIIK